MWKGSQRLASPPFPVEEEEDRNPTIFDWTRNRRGWIHLTAFLLFSVIIHGSGFYLFQVVYPSPTRVKPRADLISVMDPADPNVRSLLQRVGDRMTFLLPPSEASGVQVSVDELPIRFTPSFQTAVINPAEPVFTWTMPPALELLSDSLIPLEESIGSSIVLTPQGELLGRERAPWSIMEDYLNLAEWLPEMRLNLEIDEEGVVTVARVEGELDEQAKEEIRQVVESTLRYLPDGESSSGWLEIRRKD